MSCSQEPSFIVHELTERHLFLPPSYSTWQLKPHREFTLWEFICSLDIGPESAYQRRDAKAPMRGPPPVRPMIEENFFILRTAAIPLVLHWTWNHFFPGEFSKLLPLLNRFHKDKDTHVTVISILQNTRCTLRPPG